MPAPTSPQLHQSPQTSTRLPRKVLRRFVRINRLGPGCRVLLIGRSDPGLAQQLADLSIDAITVESVDDFDEANVEVVVDCVCDFTNADLTSPTMWMQTADMLSRVRANGSVCFMFTSDPALTVTALHRHLVPFAEAAEKPTGHDTDQIQVDVVGRSLFRRSPNWCLASMRVPYPAPDAAAWRRRATEASRLLKTDRSAA